jgi:outer membrane receptor protein involved in Fe transport
MRSRTTVLALVVSLVTVAVSASAQDTAQPTDQAAPPAAAPAATTQAGQPANPPEEIVVTGSRIERKDFVANSPVITLSSEQMEEHADITLDTYLNTLPQVNPAGTTTSNNPPNNGQSNIDLRGLGPNRNLVLIDGRRAMVSASDQTVDLNTIPAALIDSIEIISGGASAVYGADAVAGAVNLKLKDDFQGADFEYNYSNATGPWDAEEYNISGVLGANFAEEKGNAVVAFDYSKREPMIKSQRDFSAVATATTTFLPEGLYSPSGNAPDQTAVDNLFASYVPGYVAGSVPAGSTLMGFNNDGTLFSKGVFNSPLDVVNWRYPVDTAVNTGIFPDTYSYNFDAVNILRLPLKRRSFMGKLDYEFDSGIKAFALIGWTNYDSAAALAPTPIPTTRATPPGENAPDETTSALIAPAHAVTAQLIIPYNNPFVPADFAALLATRTGDNANLVGSGATEPFLMRQRTLSAGLRQSNYENTVVQYTFGLSGEIPWIESVFGSDWRWEIYGSEGRTTIDENQAGNIDTQRLQGLLEAPDGGVSTCDGGFNPFGRQGISAECVDYLEVSNELTSKFNLKIASGYISGNVAELPAGPLQLVFGAEYRGFEYSLDPGAVSGPISGFTTQNPVDAENSFKDIFAEASVPLVKDVSWIRQLDFVVGWRYSINESSEVCLAADGVCLNEPLGSRLEGKKNKDHTWKVELGWVPIESLRMRFSYQRAVRAPNFGELFDGGGSAPQYFDPCSVTTNARNGPNAAQIRQLCIDTDLTGFAGVDSYVQTPGTQLSVDTAANPDLSPEQATTYTIGAVFTSPWGGWLERLTATVDYFNIDIKDPIIADPSVNVFVANCFNYYGKNPTYDPLQADCQSIVRLGGDILAFEPPPDAEFPGINGGKIHGSGMDTSITWGADLYAGVLDLSLTLTHLFDAEQQERPGVPVLQYSGTAAYFGSGLGSSNPNNRIMISGRYTIGEFMIDARGRWYDRMESRMGIQFPGEQFDDVKAMDYWDFGVTWNFGERFQWAGPGSNFRVGLNNAFDVNPPQYTPNVQSGTDPSLYDVLGRRVYFQVNVRY